LRKVIISPLGVSRRVTPKSPSGWRLVPLVAGLGELAVLVHTGRPATTGGQALVYTFGILVTMGGLVYAGPTLTMAASRAVAARSIHIERDPFGPPGAFRTVASCTQLAATEVFGRCEPGAQTAYVQPGFGKDADQTGRVWAAAPLTPQQLRRLPIGTFAVRTD